MEVGIAAVDVGDPDAPERIEQAVMTSLGGADICVLNAGGPAPVDPLITDLAGWHAAFGSLAIQPILIASRLIGPMRERGWGRVVACLSWSVKEPIPELVYSTAGRSALAAWMKTVAPIGAADGVTIQRLTDHLSIQTTARYDRRGEEAKKRVAEMVHVPFN